MAMEYLISSRRKFLSQLRTTTIMMEHVTISTSMTTKMECMTRTKFSCGHCDSTKNQLTHGITTTLVVALVLQIQMTHQQGRMQSTMTMITIREKTQITTTLRKDSLLTRALTELNQAIGIEITTVS